MLKLKDISACIFQSFTVSLIHLSISGATQIQQGSRQQLHYIRKVILHTLDTVDKVLMDKPLNSFDV